VHLVGIYMLEYSGNLLSQIHSKFITYDSGSADKSYV